MGFFARLIDSVASTLSPSWGARRKLARAAERMVGYREAMPSRLDRQIYGRGASADYDLEVGFDRRQLVDRARQLEMDNLLAGSLLDRSTEHVVGDGYVLQMKTADEDYNREVEERWEEWCQNGADSRGILTWHEMLAVLYRSWLRDGDVALVLERDGRVRIVESDEIASKQGGHSRPSDADGIELDRRGKPLAFWIYNPKHDTLYQDRRTALHELTRVPAEDVVFVARRTRSSQTRGVTAFLGTFWLLEQIDGTLEAVTTAQRMAAAFGLVIQKKSPLNTVNTAPDATGMVRPSLNIEPGSIMRLEPDEDVKQIQAAHPGSNFDSHLKAMVRLCATRFCLGIESVLLDATEANFGNVRALSLETQKAMRIKQTRMARVSSSVQQWWLLNEIRAGRIRPRADAWKHGWKKPGRPWVDPVAELQAYMGAIDAGLKTRTQVLAEQGLDFEEVAAELARERETLDRLGLPDIRSNLTRDALPTTKSITEPKPEGKQPPTKRAKAPKNPAHLNDHGNDYNRLRDLIDLRSTRLEERFDRAATPPPAPVFHNHVTVPQGDTVIKNEVTPPDVTITHAITNEIAAAKVEVLNTTNVDVDAKIQGAAKTISVRKDSDGALLGIDVRPTE